MVEVQRKRVWIINHYAGGMFFSEGGRHYSFSKYLKELGFEPTVFCSNVEHGTGKQYFEGKSLFRISLADATSVPFVFVKSISYCRNDYKRIANMLSFYKNVIIACKEYAKEYGRPDIILASSVHPLTMVAGIQLAKHFGVKCISEVRDLWPESLVAYSTRFSRDSLLMRILYQGEKWIYQKSDLVLMTWPGGFLYIQDQGWDGVIPHEKVVHIGNGVDLKDFNANRLKNDEYALPCDNKKAFVYAGSIRKVNNLGILVDAAKVLKDRGVDDAAILIYGDGDEREFLEEKARQLGLENIAFCGGVEKEKIAAIVSKSYANILHNSSTQLDRYGQSQNKFFEYLAAGKPVLMTYSVGFSICKAEGCGLELDVQSPESVADGIQSLCELSEDGYKEMCKRARATAKLHDYKYLTNRLASELNALMR